MRLYSNQLLLGWLPCPRLSRQRPAGFPQQGPSTNLSSRTLDANSTFCILLKRARKFGVVEMVVQSIAPPKNFQQKNNDCELYATNLAVKQHSCKVFLFDL